MYVAINLRGAISTRVGTEGKSEGGGFANFRYRVAKVNLALLLQREMGGFMRKILNLKGEWSLTLYQDEDGKGK
jgi:hypothetical protein